MHFKQVLQFLTSMSVGLWQHDVVMPSDYCELTKQEIFALLTCDVVAVLVGHADL